MERSREDERKGWMERGTERESLQRNIRIKMFNLSLSLVRESLLVKISTVSLSYRPRPCKMRLRAHSEDVHITSLAFNSASMTALWGLGCHLASLRIADCHQTDCLRCWCWRRQTRCDLHNKKEASLKAPPHHEAASGVNFTLHVVRTASVLRTLLVSLLGGAIFVSIIYMTTCPFLQSVLGLTVRLGRSRGHGASQASSCGLLVAPLVCLRSLASGEPAATVSRRVGLLSARKGWHVAMSVREWAKSVCTEVINS